MSNKRESSNDINDRPPQRQQRGQADIPTLLLQVWPEMVMEYRDQRDDARAQLRVVRSILDENVGELGELRQNLTQASEEVANYARLTFALSDIIIRMAGELPIAQRERYMRHYEAAVADFDRTAIIDLTASDEEIED